MTLWNGYGFGVVGAEDLLSSQGMEVKSEVRPEKMVFYRLRGETGDWVRRKGESKRDLTLTHLLGWPKLALPEGRLGWLVLRGRLLELRAAMPG